MDAIRKGELKFQAALHATLYGVADAAQKMRNLAHGLMSPVAEENENTEQKLDEALALLDAVIFAAEDSPRGARGREFIASCCTYLDEAR